MPIPAHSAFPEPAIVATNGIELEVFTAGTPGKPIVLLHGWPEIAFAWRLQIPALVAQGYHVIVPNQRGYGASSQPQAVHAYDVHELAADVVGLLDHYGYQQAAIVGHDWGALLTWWIAQLHPERVAAVACSSVPHLVRGELPWIALWQKVFGPDYYMVHFNRLPGVAAKHYEAHTETLFRHLFRKDIANLIDYLKDALYSMLQLPEPPGSPLLSEAELEVFVAAFAESGFHAPLNWYRNFDRNWELLEGVDPQVRQPALMIFGELDLLTESKTLKHYVPHVEVHSLKAGHWIQQEQPEAFNQILLDWLARQYPIFPGDR